MSLNLTIKSILALIAVTAGLLIFAITVGGYYMIEVKNVSDTNAQLNNESYKQILDFQKDSNTRGNSTISLFKALIETQIEQANMSLQNQELIKKALNITD